MADDRTAPEAGDQQSEQAPPKKRMEMVVNMASLNQLAKFLITNYRDQVEARFPDGKGDVALFALELVQTQRTALALAKQGLPE